MNKGLDEIIDLALEKIKQATKADCVIGEKIEIEGTTLIPVCKISAGYVTGGGEYGENKNVTPLLSGGIGGGYGVKPLAFLCVSGGKVKVLGVDKPSGFEALIDVVTTAVNCFTKNCCDKKGGKKK